MSFSDEDLKRLKRRLKYHNQVHPGWFDGPEEIKIFDALLSRLEAAELYGQVCAMNKTEKVKRQYYEAWSKAAGKP